MKKLLALYVVLFASLISFAQDGIVITLEGQTLDISGQSYSMNAPSNASFDVPFHIENNTGLSQNWIVTRVKLSVPAGWTDALCWGSNSDPFGGQCYTSGQMTTNPWVTPEYAAVVDGDYGKLKSQINPDDFVSGQAHYRYYISEFGGHDYLDSVDLIVDFSASIKPIKQDPIVSISPNPANDYISINLTNAESATFRIYDSFGSVVLKDQVSGSKKINVSDFRPGIYIVTIDITGSRTFSKKLIIK